MIYLEHFLMISVFVATTLLGAEVLSGPKDGVISWVFCEVGAWRNGCAARKTLRLVNRVHRATTWSGWDRSFTYDEEAQPNQCAHFYPRKGQCKPCDDDERAAA